MKVGVRKAVGVNWKLLIAYTTISSAQSIRGDTF